MVKQIGVGQWTPERSYDISLKIKDKEYGEDVTHVRISSSLGTGYQIVSIVIKITPHTIILNKLYGQDEIKLSIKLKGVEKTPLESMDFDLMFLNTVFEVPVSEKLIDGKQQDRSEFALITVVRTPFQIMTTMVNHLFPPTEPPKTVQEIIQTLANYTGGTLKIDTENINPNKNIQTIVPPTTFYQAVKYIDDIYGIYDGVPAIYCDYKNIIHVMNLSTRITKNYNIFVEHLTTSHDEQDITKSVSDKSYFYTYDNIYNDYKGNSKFGVLAKTIRHIVLPPDNLYHIVKQDLKTVAEQYGITTMAKGEKVHINTSVTSRKKYYILNGGDDYNEQFANSMMAKEVADLARMNLLVERSLPIEKLIEVGTVVKVNTKTAEHQDVTGKYILFASDLTWNKSGQWQTTGEIELIRTNKIK